MIAMLKGKFFPELSVKFVNDNVIKMARLNLAHIEQLDYAFRELSVDRNVIEFGYFIPVFVLGNYPVGQHNFVVLEYQNVL